MCVCVCVCVWDTPFGYSLLRFPGQSSGRGQNLIFNLPPDSTFAKGTPSDWLPLKERESRQIRDWRPHARSTRLAHIASHLTHVAPRTRCASHVAPFARCTLHTSRLTHAPLHTRPASTHIAPRTRPYTRSSSPTSRLTHVHAPIHPHRASHTPPHHPHTSHTHVAPSHLPPPPSTRTRSHGENPGGVRRRHQRGGRSAQRHVPPALGRGHTQDAAVRRPH